MVLFLFADDTIMTMGMAQSILHTIVNLTVKPSSDAQIIKNDHMLSINRGGLVHGIQPRPVWGADDNLKKKSTHFSIHTPIQHYRCCKIPRCYNQQGSKLAILHKQHNSKSKKLIIIMIHQNKRNIKTSYKQVKEKVYNTYDYVRTQLKYCFTIWNPCQKSLSQKKCNGQQHDKIVPNI